MRLAGAFALLLVAACASTEQSQAPVRDTGTIQGEAGDPRNRARVHTELASLYYARGNMGVALEELRFAKDHGAVGVMKKGDREAGHWPSDPYFFPLYEEAQRLDLPICFHTGSGVVDNTPAREFTQSGFYRITLPVVHAFQAIVLHQIVDVIPGGYPCRVLKVRALKLDPHRFYFALVGQYQDVRPIVMRDILGGRSLCVVDKHGDFNVGERLALLIHHTPGNRRVRSISGLWRMHLRRQPQSNDRPQR